MQFCRYKKQTACCFFNNRLLFIRFITFTIRHKRVPPIVYNVNATNAKIIKSNSLFFF